MPTPRTIVTAALTLAALVAPAPEATASRTLAARMPVEGVEHRSFQSEGSAVHVGTVRAGAPVELRALAGAGGLERTSSMCRRAGCLVAVNGDFRAPGTRRPVGGLVQDGVLVKGPSPHHHQLLVAADGRLAAGPVALRATLVSSDLVDIEIGAVNDERRQDELAFYTPAYGASTRTNDHGVELVVRVIDPPGAVAMGRTAVAEIVEFRHAQGDTPIPAKGAVLSGHGHGAASLLDLERRVGAGIATERVLLRLDSEPGAVESLGGTPILLRDGARWFADDGSGFVRGRHPRTAVGWNPDGDVFLVTVDGRQPGHSRGMSLAELADLLLGLGATDALNLDGGGTTTMVVAGDVVNRPSDRLVERAGTRRVVHAPDPGDHVVGPVERPATTALAVVPAGARAPAGPDLGGAIFGLGPFDGPTASTTDPGSVPGADLPALVGLATPRPLDPRATVLAIGALVLASAGVGLVRRRS